MPTTFTTNDIELLGYSEPRVQYFHEQAPYSIFEAIAIAGLEKIPTKFIYLKSYCNLENARVAYQKAGQITTHTYVIKPASLRIAKDRLKEISPVQIFEHEELVWQKLKDVFSQYLDSLTDVPTERYFVLPRSQDRDIGDDLEPKLMGYMKGDASQDNGTLYVLSAHAGVGKTTVSRQLLHKLALQVARIRTIPVYVEAQHWGKLHLDSIDELWDVIDNSLRFFSSELSLRKDLFFHALRQGYLSFIFDGFDELCGQKNSPLNPVTVLEQLANIASKSEARILVTTRTLYWTSEIETPPSNVSVVQLDRFNAQQAKGYFTKYFEKNRPERERAYKLYRELVSGSFKPRQSGGTRSQFVNLPLCVAMVAAYVQRGGGSIIHDVNSELLENFLLNVCRREQERKKLKTSAIDQFLSFQELAILDDERVNPEFEFNLIEATDFEQEDIRKIIDHPFLQNIDGTRYRFSYDFLGPYFRALSISKTFQKTKNFDSIPKSLSRLVNVMAREADGKGYVSEQLNGLLSTEDLSVVARAARNIAIENKEAASFLTHICQALVESDLQNTTSSEKTEAMFGAIFGTTFLQRRLIQDWEFFGVMDRLDFRGITFHRCKFEDVTFRNCVVDDRTLFQECQFSGDLEVKSSLRDWSEVSLKDCQLSFSTDLVWGQILGRSLGSREEQIQKILRNALGRFWHHGRPKLSMRLEDWNKGLLNKFEIADEILDVMKKVGLVIEIPISGVSEGGIVFDKTSMSDLQNYMDNQQLHGKIEEVFRKLISE